VPHSRHQPSQVVTEAAA